jgi:transcriptional regulator with XRE-family HTH domain
MSFGKRLSAIRKDKKMSQEELAQKVNILANVLGRYEREEARPSIEMATLLANALEVSLDFLVGKTEKQIDQSIIDKIMTIQMLPENDQKCIMYAIDGLIRDAKARTAYNS